MTASPAAAGRELPARLDGLSTVVPVHDEEAAVAEVVQALGRVLPDVADRFEVIVVDDGSTDGTVDVLEALRTQTPWLRIVRHAKNQGYGAALRSGFQAVRHPYVFVMDGDGQFDAAQLAEVITELAGYDGVIGYRARRADRWIRRLNTAAWNRVVRGLFGLSARDLNCAFKLLPAALVQDEPLLADGAVISTEILVQAARAGYRLKDVPVAHRPRRAGRASGARLRVVTRAGIELLQLYQRARRTVRA